MIWFLIALRRPLMLLLLLLVIVASVCVGLRGIPGWFSMLPHASVPLRVGIIVALFLGWLLMGVLVLVWPRLKRRFTLFRLRRMTRLGGQSAEDDMQDEVTFAPGQVGSLIDGLFANLRKRSSTQLVRDYTDTLPWVLVMGPPGVGKNQTVQRAGLSLSLSETLEDEGLLGASSNALRILLADNGVVLTVPGAALSRGASQDTGWSDLLRYLAHRRLRRPLDGIVLTLDAELLMTRSGLEQAVQLRLRLREAMQRLNFRPQVYLLVSKLDLVPGFAAYFARADQRERQAAMGITLNWPLPERPDAVVQHELMQLCGRITRGLPARMVGLRDVQQRAAAQLFTLRFQELAERVSLVCAEIMRSGRRDNVIALRGVFFCSAGGDSKQGAEAMVDGFAHEIGMKPTAVVQPVPAGSFFCNGFFENFVFGEAGLSGRNRKAEYQFVLRHTAGYAACLAGMAAGLSILVSDRNGNAIRLRDNIHQQLTLLAALPANPDFSDLLPDLNLGAAAREIWPDRPVIWREAYFGMVQGLYHIGAAVRTDYQNTLMTRLMPVLMRGLEADLRNAVQEGVDPDRVRSDLKVYLELGNPQFFNRDDVRRWMHGHVDRLFRFQPVQHEDAMRHVNALVALLPVAQPLNDGLVAEARSMLRANLTAGQLYDQIRLLAVQSRLTDLDVINDIGMEGARFLMLRAQAHLSMQIPALYTRQGFYRVFLHYAPQLVNDLGVDSWVMGEQTQADSVQSRALLEQLIGLYSADYIRQWRMVLEQISLRALPDLQNASDALQIFAGANSPLTRLVALVDTQTTLPPPDTADHDTVQEHLETLGLDKTALPPGVEKAVKIAVKAHQKKEQTPFDSLTWPGDTISAAFAPLHGLAPGGTNAGQMAQMQSMLTSLYGTVFSIVSAADPSTEALRLAGQITSGQMADPFQSLSLQSVSLPVPLDGVLQSLRTDLYQVVQTLALQRMRVLWAQSVEAECEQSVAQYYPFVRGGSEGQQAPDMTLDDFTSFFGQGGVMDRFETGPLAPFVEVSPDGTLVPRVSAMEPRLYPAALAQVNRARSIRNMFFSANGPATLRFSVQASYLDAKALSATLTFDSRSLTYRHDPVQTMSFSWPSSGGGGDMGGIGTAGLSVVGLDGQTSTMTASGPWAAFRLFDMAQQQLLPQGRGAVFAFTTGGLQASWRILADHSFSAFLKGSDFREFRCVPQL